MSQSDEQWVRQCLADDPQAYRCLVERHQSSLLRYLRGRLGNEDEAVEAAQETFVRAYFALHTLKRPESFQSWLLGIGNRVAKESFRASRKHRSAAGLDEEAAETTSGQDGSPDDSVASAVHKLPEVYRQVILLRFYAGLSCSEISRDLNVPLGTVTKRLSRGYSLLRDSLREQDQRQDVEVQP